MSKKTYEGKATFNAEGGYYELSETGDGTQDIGDALGAFDGQRVTVTVTVKPERKARGWRWVKKTGSWSALLSPNVKASDFAQQRAQVERRENEWLAVVFRSDGSDNRVLSIPRSTKRAAKLLCRQVIEAVDGVKLEVKP